MEWSSNLSGFVPSTTPDSSSNFLFTYNYPQFPGIRMGDAQQAPVHHPSATNNIVVAGYSRNNNQEKKKRLTDEQVELLERSFQEEIKLDPDRKMKLSRELGLQPRQIAVWFQNRRARWKNKHLEHLYESLRHEFDVVSREKQMLQEEVMKLQTILRERGLSKKQTLCAEEMETVESTAIGGCSSSQSEKPNHIHTGREILNVEDCNLDQIASPNWPVLLTHY